MLSSMTKGEIVDEVVIDANMSTCDLQWLFQLSLMPLLSFVVDKLDEVVQMTHSMVICQRWCGSCVWSPWYAVDDAHEGRGAPIFDCDGWLWSCMEVW